MWGFLNEFLDSDKYESTYYFAQLVNVIRNLNAEETRLITWGSSLRTRGNEPSSDINLNLADVLSFHSYSNWYPVDEPFDMRGASHIPQEWDHIANAVSYLDKPILISEAGAGGVFGYHGHVISGPKWTEEVQSVLVQLHILSAMQNPYICGIAIWQFADSLVDIASADNITRPHGRNNKGLLNLRREPKLAFHAVSQHYSGNAPEALIIPDNQFVDYAAFIRSAGGR